MSVHMGELRHVYVVAHVWRSEDGLIVSSHLLPCLKQDLLFSAAGARSWEPCCPPAACRTVGITGLRDRIPLSHFHGVLKIQIQVLPYLAHRAVSLAGPA